jgi:hypothetical protein
MSRPAESTTGFGDSQEEDNQQQYHLDYGHCIVDQETTTARERMQQNDQRQNPYRNPDHCPPIGDCAWRVMSRCDENLQCESYRISAKIVQQNVHDCEGAGRPDMWDPRACVREHKFEIILLSA